MKQTVHSVRGDLLQWARIQQGLTMRAVKEQGGPSLSFQSEVEHLKKSEVDAALLTRWVEILQVSLPFACGEIPKFRLDPNGCRGLAQGVGQMVALGDVTLPEWKNLSVPERVREAAQLVIAQSGKVSKAVLAYVLDLPVLELEAILSGKQPPLRQHMVAVAALLDVSERLFTQGRTEPARSESTVPSHLDDSLARLADQYRAALLEAVQGGVSPEELSRTLARLRRLKQAGFEPELVAQVSLKDRGAV